MSHRNYVAERGQRDSRFTDERRAATAELVLGEVLARRREEQNISLSQLADATGIPEERLIAIDAGDAMTLHEVLWLLHVLEVSVSIGPGFDLTSQSPVTSGTRRRPGS
jgi:transcriptional regulator with XRE-family HTH domain